MKNFSIHSIRLIPLGGLGEFGANALLLEVGDYLYLIDCGIKFPEPDQYGVDGILPDFSIIQKYGKPLRALLVTHGHEDHIGGIPYLIRTLGPVPIYAPAFAARLIEKKFEEHNILDALPVKVIQPGEFLQWEQMSIRVVHVNHSIPDALAFIIQTPVGKIYHSGDWRIDPQPVGEARFDFATLARMHGKIRLMLGDSTQAEYEAWNPSETDVGNTLKQILAQHPGRVWATLFSSNIDRLKSFLKAAYLSHRNVAILGRSMRKYLDIARALGYVEPHLLEVLRDIREIVKLPNHKVLILVAGSQGEYYSALGQISRGENHWLQGKSGDLLIYSSRKIPGNEKAIYQLINRFSEMGVKILTEREYPSIHCSGHASAQDIRTLLQMLQPQYLIPIHGEYRQMMKHAELARTLEIEPFFLANGDILELTATSIQIIDHWDLNPIFIQGQKLGEIDLSVMRDRWKIGKHGLVILSMAIDQRHCQIVGQPRLEMRGVVVDARRSLLEKQALELVESIVFSTPQTCPLKVLEENLRLSLRRFFKKEIGYKPVVLPLVHLIALGV